MTRTIPVLALFLVLRTFPGMAQLSPGDLTQAHADLEGLRNCTLCHDLGNKVSNAKCLDCHKPLNKRIRANQGYHASREVKGKECADCHSEHHGRKFDMVRFDTKAFNHALTGYTLTGAHQKTDCRQCHKPDFVNDPAIRKNRNTFLGLKTECKACHEDIHQTTLGTDCASCHTTTAFSPASGFDHGKTAFPLAGKHRDVDCRECHRDETRNGKPFTVFAGVAHSNCTSCHDDPHRNGNMTACKECHTEQSFNLFRGRGRFQHQRTGFPLRGSHESIDCSACHTMDRPVTSLFADRKGVAANDCATCHEDPHEGRFGQSCADCHEETAFTRINSERFDHNLTDFALLGKHRQVDCRDCHKEDDLTAPMPHNTCAACHADYHEGEFAKPENTPDCAVCHTVDGFEGSLFSLEDHARTRFPLEGAHLATPCFACHLKADHWTFRQIGERCIDCHEDVHNGQIPETYYPDHACDRCHLPEGWSASRFDHSLTPFRLEGVHARQLCRDCHKPETGFPQGKFVGLSPKCENCHEDAHDGQFATDGGTDCRRCHGFDGWGAAFFRHDQTAFPLEGKHAELACDACHKEVTENGVTFVLYKIERFECIDCHK